MKRSYKKKPESQRKIAVERIEELFLEAKKRFPKNKSMANRYVTLARKIGMKYKVRIPKEFKRKFCKHCYRYIVPGQNCRVRTKKGNVVYYCLECRKYMKFGYRK